MIAAIPAAWRLPAAGQIGDDQLSAVVRAMPAALLCGLANAAIVISSLWSVVTPAPLLAWSACMVAISLWFYLRRREHKIREAASLSRRALRKAVLAAILLALPWAVLSTLYLGNLPHTKELMLVTVCAGMAAGGSVLLAPVYPAALAHGHASQTGMTFRALQRERCAEKISSCSVL